jgi:ABC transport system ATP-binding/permease protein
MPQLLIDNAHLAFGLAPLLDGVDLVVEAGDRIGLIGRNGAGKSSLLKAIAGEIALDEGAIRPAPGVRIGYVAQDSAFDPALSVFETVLRAARTRAHAEGDDDAQWKAQHATEVTLSQMQLDERALAGSLSGGQRRRVALACALVAQPEILLLDEPTNHLDLQTIEWLEELLRGYRGSVLLVTHDRRFLDRTVNRIAELDRGRLTLHPGSFAAYQARKREQLHAEQLANARFDKLLAQEETWIRKGIEARRTRSEGRVRRLEALRVERAARRERMGQVNFALNSGERSGEMVAELEDVSFSYGGQNIIERFSTRILRGDRVGLIGPNGAGKTTLLKLILGELEPTSGKLRRGTKLNVAYFDQLRDEVSNDLKSERTLAEVISPGSEYVELAGERKHVIGYLSEFLFTPERARSQVKSLSGGERSRLLLARLLAQPANVLVFDEPTNDLDIETLELLEQLLQDFPGTVLLVSHDREFLDNVVTQMIGFVGDGEIVATVGGYDDWRRLREQNAQQAGALRKSEAKLHAPVAQQAPPAQSKKLSYKEARELETLPDTIAALESEQAELSAKLGDPEFYRTQHGAATQAQARFTQIEAELIALLERWQALEQRAGK